MTYRSFPIQVLTILPSLPLLLARLPSIGLIQAEGIAASRSGRRGRVLCPIEHRPGDAGVLGGLRQHRDLDRPAGEDAALPFGCPLGRERALRMRVPAPSANSLRSRLSPCRLTPLIRRLPALDVSRGVRPPQAAKSRAEANCLPSPIAVTMAWAVRGPTPGMVASRRIAGSALTIAMILSSSAAIAGVSCRSGLTRRNAAISVAEAPGRRSSAAPSARRSREPPAPP